MPPGATLVGAKAGQTSGSPRQGAPTESGSGAGLAYEAQDVTETHASRD